MKYFTFGFIIGFLLVLSTRCSEAAVLRLHTQRNTRCTAILLSSNIILTAQHCIWKSFMGNNPRKVGTISLNGYLRQYKVIGGLMTNVYKDTDNYIVKDGFTLLRLHKPLGLYSPTKIIKKRFFGGKSRIRCYQGGLKWLDKRVDVRPIEQNALDFFFQGHIGKTTKGCSGGGLYSENRLVGMVLSSDRERKITQFTDLSAHWQYINRTVNKGSK